MKTLNPYILHQPSKEQLLIVDDINNKKNVKVDAVAGSGKTTTIMHIGLSNPKSKILVLTYNKLLRHETKARCLNLNIYNIDIHTYHSGCSKYFETSGSFNDIIINVGNGTAPQREPILCDILILDEMQDVDICKSNVSKRFISCMNNPPLLILGDPWQSIYNFGSSPSDSRYFTLANQIFQKEFIDRNLSTSYRITNQIAKFVNHVIGSPRIKANKFGEKVKYIVGDPYRSCKIVCNEIKAFIKQGFRSEDIFILSHSIKNRGSGSPLNKLENMLVKEGYHIFRPVDDMDELNIDEISNKVVISSFHQSKGRERPIVICFGFDMDYFKYSGKEKAIESGHINPRQCPNEWYVAMTRAIDKLIIIGGHKGPYWMHKEPPSSCVDILGGTFHDPGPYYKSHTQKKIKINVTDLVKFKTSGQVFRQLEYLYLPLLTRINKGTNVSLSQSVSGITVENVSDITALAISFMYECNKKGTIRKMDNGDEVNTIEKYLEYTVVYESNQSGYINRKNQIKSFNWLSNVKRDLLMNNYEQHVGNDPDILLEESIEGVYHTRFGKVIVDGRIDAISNNCIWEFKLTSTLKPEHILQLIIYCSLMKRDDFEYRLLNIRTGECIQIRYDIQVIQDIMNLLFEMHYSFNHMDDNVFLNNADKPVYLDTGFDIFDECLL